MRRIVSLAVAALVAWLGLGALGPVQAVPPIPVQSYAYDLHERAVDAVSTTTECGPPACACTEITYDAVDLRSAGTPAPLGGAKTPVTYTYNDTAPFVLTARRSPGAEGPDGGRLATHDVVLRSVVAANGARVFSSADAHVADAANAIEVALPRRVVGVNGQRAMGGGLSREVDIDLGNLLVQVKSGNARGLTGQIGRTQSTTGVPTIGMPQTSVTLLGATLPARASQSSDHQASYSLTSGSSDERRIHHRDRFDAL